MSTDKTKQKKASKKQKRLLNKLGVSHILNDDHLKRNLNELMINPPSIVCAKVIENCTMNVGNKAMKLPKGSELIMPLGIYNSSKYNKETRITYLEPSKKSFKDRFKRYTGQNLDNKRLLIWRFGGIGDLYFTQPLIKYLKHKYPTCNITFCTAPDNMMVFRSWPQGLVDYALPMPFSAKALDMSDYHLTFEGSIERCQEAHSVNCYEIFQRVAGLNFDLKEYPTEALSLPSNLLQIRPFVRPKTIIFQVRASSIVRTLPEYLVPKIVNALTDLGFHVAFLDSKHMARTMDGFINKNMGNFSRFSHIYNLSHISDNIQIATDIINMSQGLIGIDSSFTHIAAALKKPVVGIYGAFRGELRMATYETGDWVNVSDYWNECGRCPCYAHEGEFHLCPSIQNKPFDGVDCLKNINIDDIIKKFVTLYERFVEGNNKCRV